MLTDPGFEEMARHALALSEETLWERVKSQGDKDACDAYLTWFPGGKNRWEVQRRLQEVLAKEAIHNLGNRPSDDAIRAFFERFGKTDHAGAYRLKLAARDSEEAQKQLELGKLDAAIVAIESARNWNPDLDLRELEGGVRERLARGHAASSRLEEAIAEFGKAYALGRSVEMELGRLLVERSGQRQARRDFLGALEDLDLSVKVYSKLEGVVKRRRRAVERQLLTEIAQGKIRADGVVGALLRSGAKGQRELKKLLDGGRNASLVDRLLASGSKGLETPEIRRFRWEAVMLAKSYSDRRASAFLANRPQLEMLLDGAGAWSGELDALREDAQRIVEAHNRAVDWQKTISKKPEEISGKSFGNPANNTALDALILAGRGPDDDTLDLSRRVQLLGRVLQLRKELVLLMKQEPDSFVQGFIGRESIPTDLTGWAAFLVSSRQRAEVTMRGGVPAELELSREGGALHLLVKWQSEQPLEKEAAVSEALTLLFGTTRGLLFHHEDVDQVVVKIGGGQPLSWRVRLGLTRETSKRFNWALIEKEAPYSMEHLAYVFDQEVP